MQLKECIYGNDGYGRMGELEMRADSYDSNGHFEDGVNHDIECC